MQVAEIVSDLTSLQVCEQSAALALVSARPTGDDGGKALETQNSNGNDQDLKRANDLIQLHATFKTAHPNGNNPEFNEAREAVERIMRTLR